MVLVDTSVWIEHLRRSDAGLARLLMGGQVLCHSGVLGELACGNLKRRREVLDLLALLPRAVHASDEEALELIELHRLSGRGLGFIDVHLLAAAKLSQSALWTLDKRLMAVGHGMGLGHAPGSS